MIAYPTEGVFGLGCNPHDADAVNRILDIKNRDIAMGLIIIASDLGQINQWAKLNATDVRTITEGPKNTTWLVEKKDRTPNWVSGKHSSIAIRLTHHPIAKELCIQSKTALISTSANASGKKPPRNTIILRRNFHGIVDYIVPGECFKNTPASTIKILKTGKVVRP